MKNAQKSHEKRRNLVAPPGKWTSELKEVCKIYFKLPE